MKLSEIIAQELHKLDPLPANPDELNEIARAYRALLRHLKDYAIDYEQALALNSRRIVPLWVGAGAAARLHRSLVSLHRRPTPGMGPCTITALPRQQQK